MDFLMAIDPITAAMAAGALFKGIGSLFSKKAKQKKEKEESQNLYAAQEGQFNNQEDARLQRLNTLKGLAGTRGGVDWTKVDPATFTARHKFSGVLPTKNTGESLFGDLLTGLGNAGTSAGSALSGQADMDKQMSWICRINPALCPKGSPSSISNPAEGLF